MKIFKKSFIDEIFLCCWIVSVAMRSALGQSVPPSFITEHYPSSSQSMQFTAFASPLPEKLPLVSPSLQPQIMLYYGHHDPRGVQKENSIYPQQKGLFLNPSFDQ